MGSLRFSATPEIFDSKKCGILGNFDPLIVDWANNLWVSRIRIGCVVDEKKLVSRSKFLHTAGLGRWKAYTSNRSKHIVAYGLKGLDGSHSITDFVEECECQSSRVDEASEASLTLENPICTSGEFHDKGHKKEERRNRERRIWSRLHAMKKAVQRKASEPASVKRRPWLKYIGYGSLSDAALSDIAVNSSVEKCNSILKVLEKSNDEKTLNFFEWMRSNGKLKQNTDAYNLVIRALARKEEWTRAEMLLQEMISDSDCQLTSQPFNSLIYICSKRGLVEQGEKWFHMMLERGVQLDVATSSMLMGLYRKSGSILQAEFTFSHMRKCKIRCVTAYSAMITIYTRLGMYDKSEEIISLMEEDEVIPDLENWLVRVNTYCKQGKLKEADSALKSALEVGFSPDIVAYNMLITGFGKASDTNSAQRLFHSLRSMGLEPDETTYRSMIEGFGRTDNYKAAMWYYKQLKSSGFQPNSSNFYTMINLQARHGDDEGVIQTLNDMRMIGCQFPSILSTLLHAYERVGRVCKVPTILKSTFHENVLLDQTSCSILVMSYVQHSLLDDALQILLDKRWKDSNFEDSLYHLLICSCKEAGRYEDAATIYNQMPKYEVGPNLHVTCTMIDMYSSMNKFSDAEHLYVKLKASGITFDMIAYSIVVKMYVRAGYFKDACLVLDMMEKQKDIVPDRFLFFDMLRIYQQCGMREKLADVYYHILKSGVKLDEAMYNCIINCCGCALPVDELSRLLDEMIETGYTANTITFNVLLDVYGKAGFLKKARKIFWMAHKQGLTDIISYNTIIAAYGQSRDFSSMKYFVQRMQDAGYHVSLEAYNCMLDAYGKEGLLEEFNDVLQKMKQASCTSDHYTYNIMINIYGKKGWIEEVANVLATLKEHGLEPDLYSYNTLIKAYGIVGMVEEAVNVMQAMRAKGIEPDRVTYANLIVALQRNENFLEAVKWSLWMKQRGMASESHASLSSDAGVAKISNVCML